MPVDAARHPRRAAGAYMGGPMRDDVRDAEPGWTTSPPDDVVVLEGVSKHYRMGEVDIPALNNVDLRIPRGQFLAVVGPSGSGKTTLLNLLGGIDSPTSGRIVIDGVDISAYTQHQLTHFR